MLWGHRGRTSKRGAASQMEFCPRWEAPSMLRAPRMLGGRRRLPLAGRGELPSLLRCLHCLPLTEPCPPLPWAPSQLNWGPRLNTTSNSWQDSRGSPFLACPALVGPLSAAAALWDLYMVSHPPGKGPGPGQAAATSLSWGQVSPSPGDPSRHHCHHTLWEPEGGRWSFKLNRTRREVW